MDDPITNVATSLIWEHPLSPERPIQTLAEDELGRRDFAAEVAKVIGGWRNRDSLVLAIYGPWGSGKSSLKNMILDSIQKEKVKTIILEFNPWEWAGQEKVFEGFFAELATKLGSKDISKDAAEAAKKMRMYGSMLSAAGSIYGGVRWLTVALLALIGAFSWAPTIMNPNLQSALRSFGTLAVGVAVILASLGKTGDKLAAYLTAKAEASRKSVEELKKELHNLLLPLQTNVLVLLDDVDRLTPHGIRTVFQLVKANADFPNLVFLLLFQRDIVQRALAESGGPGEADGSQYLEKVVQVGFDIPKLSPTLLEESIESAISRIIVDGTPAERRFDRERWAKLFLSAIRPYFRTLRDVKRFSNTLSFHFELYRNGEVFDANPIDLIALEVLRLFEPSLYECLFAGKELLTGAPRSALGFDFSLEGPSAADVLIKKAKHPEQARGILSNVFPPLSWALSRNDRKTIGNTPYAAAYRAEWLNGLRACHPDIFERYFKFSLSAEDLSESEMTSLLALVGNREGLVERLTNLADRNLLSAAVIRLRAQNPSISTESAVPFVGALLDIEKQLLSQPAKVGTASVPTEIQAILVIDAVVRQLSTETRGDVLRKAIETTTALYLTMVLADQSGEQKLDPLISETDAKMLQEICIKKIRSAELSPALLMHPRLRYILKYWSEWASYEEVSQWMHTALESDAGISRILTAFTESMSTIADDGRPVSTQYRFALDEFMRYAKPEDLAERARSSTSAEKEDRAVFRLFLQAVDQWKATGQIPQRRDFEGWTPEQNL